MIRSMPAHPQRADRRSPAAVVELAADDDERSAAAAPAHLQQECGMRSFAEKDPTLEDVFMMVTKGLVT